MTIKDNNKFCVYEHLKKTDGVIFYVGKGTFKRAKAVNPRNKYWKHIVKKHGFSVNILASNLDEELSFLVEIERICQLKRLGVKLANLTTGGEGVGGELMSIVQKEVQNRPEVKEKNRKSKIGVSPSAETRLKMSLTHKKKYEDIEYRNKKAIIFSKFVLSKESQEKANVKRRLAKRTQALKDLMSKKLFGIKRSLETKNKMSAAQKIRRQKEIVLGVDRRVTNRKTREKIACTICGVLTDPCVGKRWHFDNCKRQNYEN